MKKQIAVLAFAILLLPFIPFMNAASAQGVSYAALHSVQFIGYAPGTLVISLSTHYYRQLQYLLVERRKVHLQRSHKLAVFDDDILPERFGYLHGLLCDPVPRP